MDNANTAYRDVMKTGNIIDVIMLRYIHHQPHNTLWCLRKHWPARRRALKESCNVHTHTYTPTHIHTHL